MYKIYTQKPKTAEIKVKVELGTFKFGKVPRAVFLGIGNKPQRYANYLATAFTEAGIDVLRLLAHVHLQGCEHGDMLLVGERDKPYHAQVVKEFLEANASFLDTVIPYLFPGKKTAAEGAEPAELPEELKEKFEREKMTPLSSSKMTLADLPEDDRNQIQALIAADQARQAEEAAKPIPITLSELPLAGESAQPETNEASS